MSKVSALCFIKVERYRFEILVKELRKIAHLKKYHVITGDYDGILEMEVDDVKELYKIFKELENIEAITEMNTHIIIKSFDLDGKESTKVLSHEELLGDIKDAKI